MAVGGSDDIGRMVGREIVTYGPVASAKPSGTIEADGPGTYEFVVLATCKSWEIEVTSR